MKSNAEFRFSFGPWNIHEGADVFGPAVRKSIPFSQKLASYKKMGFDGVQFHDDDAVSSTDIPHDKMIKEAVETKNILDNEGLIAEFVAPRLWEHPDTIDGGYTANDSAVRKYSIDRSKKAIDIANVLGTKNIVIWPAREGIYVNESKNHLESTRRIVHALNEMLEYDKDIRILGEMKPNEPMDHAYSPTTGHFMALGHGTVEPDRVGILIESAHAILAGIDPAMEMAFAMSQNKLWSVHLNDQNGMKFDEDRIFGSINLKRAFDQVLVLYENDFGVNGEFIGLDVKALRTQKDNVSTRHLTGSMEIFLELLEVVKNLDMNKVEEFRVSRDYEELEIYIIGKLMGK